ncbi:O-antigen polysaccharide polymerase Wzy family protein [Schinkia azotoformans]|nr:O-antigen polysaccharide polymerase Wzy family protein [Schinkia azotoformans]
MANCSILIITLATSADLTYMLALMVWINMMIYAYKDLEHRSMLFAYGIAFFVFLMGRDLLQQVFKYKEVDYAADVQTHAYLSILLALLSLWTGYYLLSKKRRYKNVVKDIVVNHKYLKYIQQLSLVTFCISWIFAVASKIIVARFISANSYFDYYTDYSEFLRGNIILYSMSKIEILMPVALSIFMATLPTKKQFKIPMVLYGIYTIVSLGSGQRSTFMLGLLWIFVYLVFRSGLNKEEGWFDRKLLLYGVLAAPVLAIFGSIYSIWREGGDLQNINYMSSFFDFFYDQGVTINAIKNAYIYADSIPHDNLYTLEFLQSGLLARILGITVYYGNTVEHALYGGSFTHALAYAVLGNLYLSGRGTGSSYIAELFFDFGYVGIVLGNFLYSYIILNITRIAKKSPFLLSICFTMVTQLLWAPRGSFSGMITILFYPTTVLTYILIFGVSKLLASRK